ncbi:unnamed protein product [Clavelina lepadiformis]|uniref:TIR domain-containing protein n=1 Tax=Clavelina lepadiformis TaxID=159417 RepID=A0ABP0GKL4_CLALP
MDTRKTKTRKFLSSILPSRKKSNNLRICNRNAKDRITTLFATLPHSTDGEEVGSDDEQKILTIVKAELQQFYDLPTPWDDAGETTPNFLKNIAATYAKQNLIIFIGELMVEYKFLDVCIRIWDFCHSANNKQYMFLSCATYNSMKSVVLKFSDECLSLAKAAYQNEVFIKRCVSEFDLPELGVDNLTNYNRLTAVRVTMSILMNMARHFHPVSSLIRCNKGLDNIIKYYEHDDLGMKAAVIITAAHCITEDESYKILAGTDVMPFIVKQLTYALEQFNCNYSAAELVIGLDKLSFNDSNKKLAVDLNVLPLLTRMINQISSSAQMHAASHCIWTLSFLSDNENKIRREPGLLEAVHHILFDSAVKPEIKCACEGILFNIERVQPSFDETNKTAEIDKHIMISYQWNKQPTILMLRDYLNKLGLKTWVDVDKMQGSILEEMAHAVENAGVVVIAMNEDYKNSNSCRTEAEYAYKLRKPIIPLLLNPGYDPDGWLGALLGTKLYVDLSSENDCEGKFPDVVNMIMSKMSSEYDLSQTPVSLTVTDSPESCPSDNQLLNVRSLKSWTSCNVKEWAEKNGIGDIEVLLSSFDGVDLFQLHQLMKRSPEIYYTALRSDYLLGWSQIFHLTEALEILNKS